MGRKTGVRWAVWLWGSGTHYIGIKNLSVFPIYSPGGRVRESLKEVSVAKHSQIALIPKQEAAVGRFGKKWPIIHKPLCRLSTFILCLRKAWPLPRASPWGRLGHSHRAEAWGSLTQLCTHQTVHIPRGRHPLFTLPLKTFSALHKWPENREQCKTIVTGTLELNQPIAILKAGRWESIYLEICLNVWFLCIKLYFTIVKMLYYNKVHLIDF